MQKTTKTVGLPAAEKPTLYERNFQLGIGTSGATLLSVVAAAVAPTMIHEEAVSYIYLKQTLETASSYSIQSTRTDGCN